MNYKSTGDDLPTDTGRIHRAPLEAEIKHLTDIRNSLLAALKGLDALYVHAWDLVDPSGAVVFFPETVAKFEKLHDAAQTAIAKAEGKP